MWSYWGLSLRWHRIALTCIAGMILFGVAVVVGTMYKEIPQEWRIFIATGYMCNAILFTIAVILRDRYHRQQRRILDRARDILYK